MNIYGVSVNGIVIPLQNDYFWGYTAIGHVCPFLHLCTKYYCLSKRWGDRAIKSHLVISVVCACQRTSSLHDDLAKKLSSSKWVSLYFHYMNLFYLKETDHRQGKVMGSGLDLEAETMIETPPITEINIDQVCVSGVQTRDVLFF